MNAAPLVIFDCDGVLIDSEMLAINVEVALLAEEGIEVDADFILERYVGISMAGMIADLERRFARRLGDDFVARHGRRLEAIFARELRAIAGVAAVIDGLAQPRCVASSSSPERLRHTLGLVGLYDRFHPHVFSATMVARGKPAPDLFLHAAREMGADPARAIVVEDSGPGVTAAVAAGMIAIGFTGASHCRPGHDVRLRQAGAAAIVDDMAALPAVLADLSRRLR